MIDYEIQRCSRHCAATGRELAPGESYYSVLVAEGGSLTRRDYAADAWQGPPAEAIAWWKSRLPDPRSKRGRAAPNEVLLECFDQLLDRPEQADMLYVLTLLLVRRRVMRLEDTETDVHGRQTLVLECPRRDATYRVGVATPPAARIAEIEQELERLLE